MAHVTTFEYPCLSTIFTCSLIPNLRVRLIQFYHLTLGLHMMPTGLCSSLSYLMNKYFVMHAALKELHGWGNSSMSNSGFWK